MKNISRLVQFTLLLLLSSCTGKPLKTEMVEVIPNRKISAADQFKYTFYSSLDDAKVDYNKYYSKEGEPLSRTENYSDYTRVEKVVTDVLTAYKSQFPGLRKTIGDNKIWVILYDSDTFGAFAPSDASNESSHFYIAISKKVLESSHNTLYGLVSHEMAHILLQKNSLNKEDNIPREFYYDINRASLKGILANNVLINLNLQKKMKVWEDYASWTGEYSNSNFKGVGLTHDFDKSDFLFIIYSYILKKNCAGLKESFRSIRKLESWIAKNGGPIEVYKKMGQSDSLKIINQFGIFEEKIKECLGYEKVNIFELFRNYYLSIGNFKESYSLDQFKISTLTIFENSVISDFNKTALHWLETLPLKDALFKIVHRSRFKMRELEKSINFKNVRKYTDEDHADELAVKILKILKIPFDDLFLSLGQLVPSQKQCSKVPVEEPYSPINQKHHSSCWRYWRAGQLIF